MFCYSNWKCDYNISGTDAVVIYFIDGIPVYYIFYQTITILGLSSRLGL